MPPANSRAHSPLQADSTSSSTYLSALRPLDSIPVPDLASTLHLSHSPLHYTSHHRDTNEEANDANIAFLRTHLDPQEEWRAQNADAWEELQHRQRERERLRRRERGGDAASTVSGGSSTGAIVSGQGNGGEDRARRERLQRVLNRLNRMHDTSSPLGVGGAQTRISQYQSAREAAYGDRIQTSQENNVYDWSPMGELQRELDGERSARQDQADVEDERRVERDVERAAVLIYSELRRDQPNTHPDVLRATARARAREQIETERDAARRRAYSSLLSTHQSGNYSSTSEQPLRNQALLQSVRRHPRFSQRSREYMQRYVIDRERYQNDSDERDRWQEQRARWSSSDGRWPQSPLANTESDRYDLSRMAWQNHSSSSVDRQSGERSRTAYRRNYLEDPSRARTAQAAPEPSEWLQKTILYLANLRDCLDYEDALSHAVDADFLTKEFMGENQADFLLDIEETPRPQETSWLAPGAVFSGSQHATNGYTIKQEQPADPPSLVVPPQVWQTMTPSERRAQVRRETRRHEERLRAIAQLSHADLAERVAARTASSSSSSSKTIAPDRWPVKVTIHAVDWDKMTMAATMEAYNVPHHNSSYSSIISAANAAHTTPPATADTDMPDASSHPPIHPKSSSITTYLEGEIVDFTQHTLLTESYPSDRRNDALYWRKLEPFAHLESDDDMVRTLVSKDALEELNRKYILMRWKERCFIPASSASPVLPSVGARGGGWDGARPWLNQGDSVMAETGEGCGLTISGFYYVCLRREDGEVEGLYCDPESSPYQHLRLGRVGGGVFPTWSFA